MPIYVKNSDSWKNETPYVKVNGIWKPAKQIYIKTNDQWKKTYESYTPPAWSTGTDAQIIEALQKHYNGEIDLRDYWNVGDARTISLSAMSASYVNESHAAQTTNFYILDKRDLFSLTTPINGHTYPAFIVGMREPLSEQGRMHADTSSRPTWNNCNRHSWCNDTFYNAISNSIRSIFKQFNLLTANRDNQEDWSGGNYFALFAEKEVFGICNRSYSVEDSLTQFQRHASAVPYAYGSDLWFRSPWSSYNFAVARSNSSTGDFSPYSLQATKNAFISVFGVM